MQKPTEEDMTKFKVTPVHLDLIGNLSLLIITQPKYYGPLFSERAKILFQKGDFQGAIDAYSMAIVYSYDEEFLARILSNRSLAQLKKGRSAFLFEAILKVFFRHYEAFIDASEAVRLDQSAHKAMFRIGKALSGLGYYSKARELLTKAMDLCADDKDKNAVRSDLEKIDEKVVYFLHV